MNRYPTASDFVVRICRGEIINGRAGWQWAVFNKDERLIRYGWTAGAREEAELEARRDVHALCARSMCESFIDDLDDTTTTLFTVQA